VVLVTCCIACIQYQGYEQFGNGKDEDGFRNSLFLVGLDVPKASNSWVDNNFQYKSKTFTKILF
jgi:hypothetical protein